MWWLVFGCALCGACGRIGFDLGANDRDAAGDAIDGMVDAAPVLGGTRITNDPADSHCPSVAADGTHFGVAWVDARDGNDEIYFVLLDLAGAHVSGDQRLTTTAAQSGCPRLLWNGTGWAVVWPEGPTGAEDLYFLSLAATGAPLGAPIRLTNDPDGSSAPSLVFDGATYGLVWESHGGNGATILFTTLSATGSPGTAVAIASQGTDNRGPGIGWTGTAYGVAWSNDNGPGEDLSYRPVTPPASLGTVILVSPLFFVTKTEVAMVWHDVVFATAWRDSAGGDDVMYAGLLGASGSSTSPVALGNAGYDIEDSHQGIVVTPTGYAIVWARREVEILLVGLDVTGAKVQTKVVTNGTGSMPSIGVVGSTLGIAWQDVRDGNAEIYFAVE